MCRGGGFAPTSGSGRTVEGRPLQRPPWRLCCAVHIYGPPTVPATRGLKRRKNRALAGKPSAAVGLNPHSGGPGEAGVGLGTRGRAGLRAFAGAVPQGLRGSCPAAGAVPQRSEGGVFFVFVSLCVGGRGCNGRGPKTTPVRGKADTTRPAGACGPAGGFLRSSSSRRPSRHVLPLKR